MRRILMAGVAVVGAVAVHGAASAQTVPAPSQVTGPSATVVGPLSGGATGANNNNNYQAAALPGKFPVPQPGTMVVRFGGRIWAEGGVQGSSADRGPKGAKLAPYSLGTYIRLYPGIDAMATNGLRYGAAAEFRENFTTAGNSTANTGASALTSAQTLYVRRAFVYMANPTVGILRIGQGDGVSGIFDNGIASQQGFNNGGWNGDEPTAIPGNAAPTFAYYTQQGAEYGSQKIVYLSPQFFGFDIGVNYTPNNGNLEFQCAIAATGCTALSSSAVDSDGARFKDQYQAGIRYQGVFGPVALLAFGDYIGSGRVNYTGTAEEALAAQGAPAGSRYTGRFKGQSVGFVGAEVTVAGLGIGGLWQGGQYNGVMSLEPQGGVSANAWIAGVQYTTGPLVVGASYGAFDSQGSVAMTGLSQRHETLVAAGGTYTIAPGIAAYLEYLYGTRHQGDFDFLANKPGLATHNNVQSQGIMLGFMVSW